MTEDTFEPTPPPVEFTAFDAEGRITNAGYAPAELVSAQIPAGSDFVLAFHDDATTWMPGGIATPRPNPPEIPTEAIAGAVLAMANVSTGAAITVTDEFGTATSYAHDPDDPLILTDPGIYTINVVQPFPEHDAFQWIEVSHA